MTSIKATCLFVVFLCFATTGNARGHLPTVETLAPRLQEQTNFLNPEYLLFMPDVESSETLLPLVIYLHGGGGKGDEITKIQGQAMGVWHGIQRFDKEPCIVVAPQCLRLQDQSGHHSTWTAEDLNVLLQHLKATLPVDTHRIYLTGNSMGGYGSWMWGAHNPEHFAAIAPISGGIGQGGPKDVTPNLDQWAVNLAKLPVYAFVGADDKVVPAERSERLIDDIRKAGGTQAQLTVYPDRGHNAGQAAYTDRELYDWMFEQRRN